LVWITDVTIHIQSLPPGLSHKLHGKAEPCIVSGLTQYVKTGLGHSANQLTNKGTGRPDAPLALPPENQAVPAISRCAQR